MCGIFGIISTKPKSFDKNLLQETVDKLFKLSESRGKEAAGLAVMYIDKIQVYKQPLTGSMLIKLPRYKQLLKETISKAFESNQSIALIGHSRLATNGLEVDNNNNQPVISGKAVGVHNGIIVNDSELWKKYPSIKRNFQVDTEILVGLLSHYRGKGYSMGEIVRQTYDNIKGAATIAAFLSDSSQLILMTNTGSLYEITNKVNGLFIFASEEYILRTLIEKTPLTRYLKSNKIHHIHAGFGLAVETVSLRSFPISLQAKAVVKHRLKTATEKFTIKEISKEEKSPKLNGNFNVWPGIENKLSDLRKHKPPFDEIRALKRCAKCILPVTMPLIEFDEDGVCNYCRNYKIRTFLGKKALEDIVQKYRSKDGEPDCIVAFSGGRDSSYGLHYMKNIMHMNPIAYTYDWAMVTDLGRRNQYRITGELGIEHIIVSADIRKKRQNIRKNVLAWLKRPDIGIVPLFMAGDKQAEYYAEDLKRKTGIRLVIYCRGNELENEEFKWGFCGIKEGSPGGVLHNLALEGKIRLATYYGKQYLLNPAYINSSIYDTLFAYFVAYVMPLDFQYLWHYIRWDEDEIINTLTKKYGWESTRESKVTWRIDDGSVPFYNYIYYTIAGFTENDTFRSNQIREGIMTRKKALALAEEENRPRYEGLKNYFDLISINGHRALTIIDGIPKQYRPQ